MPGLVALDFGPGDDFVAPLISVWKEGKVAMSVDQRLPEAARAGLLEHMRPTELWNVTTRVSLADGV